MLKFQIGIQIQACFTTVTYMYWSWFLNLKYRQKECHTGIILSKRENYCYFASYCTLTALSEAGHIKPHKMSCMTKPTAWPLRPGKTQISLGIQSLLSTWRNIGYQLSIERMAKTLISLIWVFAWRTDNFVGFVLRWLKFKESTAKTDQSVDAQANQSS